jgi:hypothetical protein
MERRTCTREFTLEAVQLIQARGAQASMVISFRQVTDRFPDLVPFPQDPVVVKPENVLPASSRAGASAGAVSAHTRSSATFVVMPGPPAVRQ